MIAGLLFSEACLFLVLYLRKNKPDRKADAIVVFTGRPFRVAAGYDLAQKGYAQFLIVSSAPERILTQADENLGLPAEVVRIKEDQARSTFENAVIVSRIMEDRNFKRVILITDWIHMPRAWFFLRLMLRGQGRETVIRKNRIAPKTYPQPGPWYIFRHVYNEYVSFWGSLVEYAAYRLSGELPPVSHKESALIRTLKAILLF